jgi:hypothetical protein
MRVNPYKNQKTSKVNNICLVAFSIFILVVCTKAVNLTPLTGCQGKSLPNSKVDQKDVSSIDSIIKAVYESITFSKGNKPDLNRFRHLFINDAQFIRITEKGPALMSLDSFITSFGQRIKDGKLVSFHESEVSRKENTFGKIAQVFSTYTKCMNKENPVPERTGVNSFQLFHDGMRWWICSLLWQDKAAL